MRLGPAIHGVLLALVLVFAYKTWTREKPVEPKGGDIVVWTESPESFESLVFEGKNKKIVIERRADDAGTYLWGSVSKTQSKVAKPDPHGGMHGGHGAPPKPLTPPKDGATPTPPKGGATPAPAPKGGAKPAPAPKGPKGKAAPPAKAKKATPAPAKAKPADGKKANQNDPIPQDPGAGAPAKPAPGKAKPAAPTKPKQTPAKPAPAKPTPAKPGDKPATDPAAPAAGAGTPAPPKPAAPAVGEKQTTVREFPIGDAGTKLVAGITSLRALRELGVPNEDQKIEYGLDETEETLTIKFKGGVERTLLVGDRAFGSSDRYVLEKASGKGYVLSSSLMKNFDSSEATLGLKKYNDFDVKDDLAQLTVDVDGATQTLLRLEIEEEAKPGAKKPPKTRLTWARKDAPETEDVTMANFVDRASKLRPVEYFADLKVDSLTLIARFEYAGKDGKAIGFLDFYKGADPKSDKPDVTEYFMRTERTRVLGKVSKLTAERVDQDLAEVFGTTPTEEAPQPTE